MRSSAQAVAAVARALEPIKATTLADRSRIASWIAIAGGDLKRVYAAIADAKLDAAQALGGVLRTAGDVHAWVEVALMDEEPRQTRGGRGAPLCRAPSTLRRWVVDAAPGEVFVYHVGQLARDRISAQVLDATAQLVHCLDDLGAVRATIATTSLPACAVYCAQRRGGHAAHPLVTGAIAARHYWALRVLERRPSHVAVVKALERGMPCSAAAARELVAEMIDAGLLRRVSGCKGHAPIVTTDRGAIALRR